MAWLVLTTNAGLTIGSRIADVRLNSERMNWANFTGRNESDEVLS